MRFDVVLRTPRRVGSAFALSWFAVATAISNLPQTAYGVPRALVGPELEGLRWVIYFAGFALTALHLFVLARYPRRAAGVMEVDATGVSVGGRALGRDYSGVRALRPDRIRLVHLDARKELELDVADTELGVIVDALRATIVDPRRARRA